MKKVINLFREKYGCNSNADLRERAQVSAEKNDVDLSEDAEYLKDLKKTSKFGWIWIVLIVLAVLSLLSIILI